MGKKNKKSKLSKTGVRIISKGFNDVSDSERERLSEYFDNLFEKELGDGRYIQDNSSYDDYFEEELGIVEPRREKTEKERQPIITENDVRKDVQAEDVNETGNITENSDIDSDLTDVEYRDEESDKSSAFDWIIQQPLIFDEDYYQINVLSNLKNARSYDLTDALFNIDNYVDNDVMSDTDLNNLKEWFRTLLISCTHPSVIVKKSDFEIDFVRGLNRIPVNAVLSEIEYKGVQYVGILIINIKDLNNDINALFDLIKVNNITAGVLYDLLPYIVGWGFKPSDVLKYVHENIGMNINNVGIEACLDYFQEFGETVVNTNNPQVQPSYDQYIKVLMDKKRIVNSDDGVNIVRTKMLGIIENFLHDDTNIDEDSPSEQINVYKDDEESFDNNENDDSEYDHPQLSVNSTTKKTMYVKEQISNNTNYSLVETTEEETTVYSDNNFSENDVIARAIAESGYQTTDNSDDNAVEVVEEIVSEETVVPEEVDTPPEPQVEAESDDNWIFDPTSRKWS